MKKIVVFLAILTVALGGPVGRQTAAAANPVAAPVKAPVAMTMKANIALSNQAAEPAVNNGVQTILLQFSQALDVKTTKDSVKLYRIDQAGNAVAADCYITVEPYTPSLMRINNLPVEKFAEGEEYKIVVSSKLKSTAGAALEKDYIGYFATNYRLNLADPQDTDQPRSQIVVISDLHLGNDDAYTELRQNKKALVDFLKQIKKSARVKELVIAGDLLDGWFIPMDFEMPKTQALLFAKAAANNQSIIDAFNEIIRAGEIKVTYLPGNHDLLATEAVIGKIFPGINQSRDEMQGLGSYTTGAQAEIAIEHGHRYDFFCAPDPISNRDITKNNTSILPPGYFFTRIATSSIIQGRPLSGNKFAAVKPDPQDPSQFDYYLYHQIWQGLMTALPIRGTFSDKLIKTNIDGYTGNYAINDFIPQQDPLTGKFDLAMYKDIQNTWAERQKRNAVKVAIPADEAIAKVLAAGYFDSQAKKQYFDVDATKRIVVFGHSHFARVLPMVNLKNEKTIYANSGTWIDTVPGYPTRTFIVITPAKPGSAAQFVNLYQYGLDDSVTQWGNAQAITNLAGSAPLSK